MRFWPVLVFCLFAIRSMGGIPSSYRKANGLSGTEQKIRLKIEIRLNRKIYQLSNFGEPPQLAVWLENDSCMQTIWVTFRAGKGYWEGKAECPTALPCWAGRYAAKAGHYPSILHPIPDALTGATPKTTLTAYAEVPEQSSWNCYLEMNVSGDYNRIYRSAMPNGFPDPDGNGQPSLIYCAGFKATSGSTAQFRLAGRSEQIQPVTRWSTDLSGITTAAEVLDSAFIRCEKADR